MTSEKIEYYLTLAAHEALKSNKKRARVGSILIYKNKIYATGFNMQKSTPIQYYYNKYRDFIPLHHDIHAEVMCISRAKKLNIDFNKSTLIIARILKNGEYAIARPCPACMHYAKNTGIRHIYYTTSNTNWAYERIN